MKRLFFAALAVASPACAPTGADIADLAIENVTVIDMAGAAPFVASVVIDDGRIVAVKTDGGDINAAARIDAAGKFLIPGLIDSHTHAAGAEPHPEALEALLDAGVTTIRDMGGMPDTIAAWRKEIADGARRGPDIISVGMILNGEAVTPAHYIVASPEVADAAVAKMAEFGAAQIKVHNALTADTFAAIIEAAKARDLKVVGHIPFGPGPLGACELGMGEISHASALMESVLWRDEDPAPDLISAITELTGEGSDPYFTCMAERGMAFAPNLSMYSPILASMPEEQAAMTGRLVDKLGESALRAKNKGVRIIAATDSNGGDNQIAAGAGLHVELQLLVKAGFTEMEALQTATANPAGHLDRSDLGTIEAGKQADLVLLCADPLADIANTEDIDRVIADGVPVFEGAGCG